MAGDTGMQPLADGGTGAAPGQRSEIWYFAPKDASRWVTLPKFPSKQQHVCGTKDDDKPYTRLSVLSTTTEVRVTESADKCEKPRNVALVLLGADLLALDADKPLKVFKGALLQASRGSR